MAKVGRAGRYNVPKATYNGVRYDSPMEARYAQGLDIRKRAGQIAGWRRQVRLPIIVNDAKICTYVVDFEVTHNDGTVEMVEVKGVETAVWKIKWKLTKAIYGTRYRFTVVKQY